MSWVLGWATVYHVAVGGVLFCDTPQAPQRVGQVQVPWVAVDRALFDQGWACGDHLLLTGPGWQLEAQLLDAGPLAGWYVEQPAGGLEPIVVDVPSLFAPFAGLSSGPVLVQNMSAPWGQNEANRSWD